MHLAYELKKNNTSVFTNTGDNSGYTPKNTPLEGISAILSKYKK